MGFFKFSSSTIVKSLSYLSRISQRDLNSSKYHVYLDGFQINEGVMLIFHIGLVLNFKKTFMFYRARKKCKKSGLPLNAESKQKLKSESFSLSWL
jgi:hypothetical protein